MKYTGYEIVNGQDEDGIQYIHCDFFFIDKDGEEVYISSPLYDERFDLFYSGVALATIRLKRGEEPIEVMRSSFRQIYR